MECRGKPVWMSMNRSSGYTLIEVLIMLAVTAILAATVLETVRASTSNGLRIEGAARQASQDYITLASVRRAVEASRADYRDGPYRFRGDETRFSAMTGQPAASSLPGAQPYTLSFIQENGGVSLVYEDDAGRLRLGFWSGGSGRFSYYGEASTSSFDALRSTLSQPRQREWMEQWPPLALIRSPEEPNEYYQALPQAVRADIEMENGGYQTLVFAFPITAPPKPRMSDILGNLGQ